MEDGRRFLRQLVLADQLLVDRRRRRGPSRAIRATARSSSRVSDSVM